MLTLKLFDKTFFQDAEKVHKMRKNRIFLLRFLLKAFLPDKFSVTVATVRFVRKQYCNFNCYATFGFEQTTRKFYIRRGNGEQSKNRTFSYTRYSRLNFQNLFRTVRDRDERRVHAQFYRRAYVLSEQSYTTVPKSNLFTEEYHRSASDNGGKTKTTEQRAYFISEKNDLCNTFRTDRSEFGTESFFRNSKRNQNKSVPVDFERVEISDLC